MKIYSTSQEIQNWLKSQNSKTIGFVPTMGALHKGHLSLIKASKKKCNRTITSIFVNPTQFGPNEDYANYPRTIEQDCELLKQNGVDAVFIPNIEEIYPNNQKASIPPLPSFIKLLEGASRPTHFLGVAQIVKRFFEIIKPTHTFFGQKDYQQILLIKWLIDTFKLNINLSICPIIREKDGLALSSRNQYLNSKERKKSLILSQTLNKVQSLIKQGEKDIKKLEKFMHAKIEKSDMSLRIALPTDKQDFEDDVKINIDYAVIRDCNDLSKQKKINHNSIALLAVRIGKTRLIDNNFLQLR